MNAPAVAATPRRAPVRWRSWLRTHLFRSPRDSIVTVVAAALIGYVLYRLLRYVLVTGRWDVVRSNLSLFMVGRYPADEQWRVVVAAIAIATYGGLVSGYVLHRRLAAGAPPDERPLHQRVGSLLVRLWPLILGALLTLSLTSTAGPWLAAAGVVAGAVIGRLVGRRLPVRRTVSLLVLVAIVGGVVLVSFLTGPVGWDDWGGLMLNLFLAAISITLCFPFGVLLALGRRSRLPLVRAVSVAYIELFRGVPLYVLLLLAAVALGFFMPSWAEPPGFVVRAVVVLTVFTAAYVAEIVRGGLQSLPRGQSEAAHALGLSPTRTTMLVVLPQALRNVIPALVGQFISLFKDTTLAGAAMSLFEIYVISRAVTAQPEFQGQGLFAETTAFLMLLFWVGCITMSRESQRLEKRLGVGER